MLFEKLQFFSEIKYQEFLRKKKEEEVLELENKEKEILDLATIKWHGENETLLKNIKDLYSRKLPLLKQQKNNAFNKGQKEESPLKLRL